MSAKFRLQTADPMHLQIERHLQRQILTGALVPAQRLPTTRELATEWKVDYKTVQRAMQRLSGSGLIERKPRRGTFVRATAEKAVIGIIVGPDLLHPDTYFDRALVKAVKAELGPHRWVGRVYDNLSGRPEKEKDEMCRHLLYDIRNHAFKGLVWIDAPVSRFKDEVLMTDLPKVLFGSDVRVDLRGFTRAAVDELVRRGRRRLFYLRSGSSQRGALSDLEGFEDGCAAHGLQSGRDLVCQMPELCYEDGGPSAEWLGYERMLAVIESWEKRQTRPEGLIVSDDVMMKGMAVALRERGIRVPEDLEVVCSANEGIRHLYAVPVIRYEFPIRAVVHELIRRLWRRVVGETVDPRPIVLQGRFAGEPKRS